VTIPGADKLVIIKGDTNEKEFVTIKSPTVRELVNLVPLLNTPTWKVLTLSVVTLAALVEGA
jgi:hypothetical protein